MREVSALIVQRSYDTITARQTSRDIDIRQTVHRRNPTSEPVVMIRPMIVVTCVFASYFVIFWLFSGYWGKALMTGILASLVFSLTLLAASFVSQGQPWRAFWIANTILILVFGGTELYAALTLNDSHATRFGGALLVFNGHITAAGFASIVFDIAICTLSNFLGFYLSQFLVRRLNVE